MCAGPAQGGNRQCTSSGEAGAAGEDRAEDGAVQRARAQGDSGEAARHGAEEQRYIYTYTNTHTYYICATLTYIGNCVLNISDPLPGFPALSLLT